MRSRIHGGVEDVGTEGMTQEQKGSGLASGEPTDDLNEANQNCQNLDVSPRQEEKVKLELMLNSNSIIHRALPFRMSQQNYLDKNAFIQEDSRILKLMRQKFNMSSDMRETQNN